MNNILVISGPTASGKSGLALQLADHKDIYIINADSLQIYQGLPILSAQPNATQLAQVPHVLYSHLKPHERSSVGLWLRLVEGEIRRCFAEGILPVIVGGTGMYISKLIEGMSVIPEIDETVKTQARQAFETLGAKQFKAELVALGEDQDRIATLDKQRLIRAFEVAKHTGKTLHWWHSQDKQILFDKEQFIHVNLNPDRQALYHNCNKRFNMMLEHGAVKEVRDLLAHVKEDDPITKTLGFDEISKLICGKISEEEAIEIASQKTRNYAKRQLTWFRHQLSDKSVFDNLDQAHSFITNII